LEGFREGALGGVREGHPLLGLAWQSFKSKKLIIAKTKGNNSREKNNQTMKG